MSLYALSWAFEQKLPPNEKIVLLALADCENGETLRCDPKQAYIAERASVSERQVRDMLTALEERGLIQRRRRGGLGGGRKSDDYRLGCRPPAVDNSWQPADSAGEATGRNQGGNRQTAAGIENRKEPEVNTGQVSDVTTGARALAGGTGPGITPATVSATHGKPFQPADVFASVGPWMPTTFDDEQLHRLAAEILAEAPGPVLDRTAYVIAAIRNTVKHSERQRGRWLLRADEIAYEAIAYAEQGRAF
ncbi:helix-turn-helix domain-containing protein [Microbacterium sp.]|uniref:helix-turn-helix domain-containing protein n=1 Tax=Microbacterium sp. TaxID=51671 RepID=UPI003F6E506B